MIMLITLLLFGSERLPDLARNMGKAFASSRRRPAASRRN